MVTLLGLVSFQSAAQESMEDARDKREQVRQDKAAAAAKLDAAKAEDAEVARALRDITDIVVAQQSEVTSATRVLEANLALAADAEAQVQAAVATQSDLESNLAATAVSGFVNRTQTASAFLGSSDLTEALRQTSLLEQANVDTVELLDQLRIVAEDRELAENAAAAAVAEAVRLEAELESKLTAYEEQKLVQETLKAEMARRVAEWQSEVDAFESEEDALSAYIRAEEARLAPPATNTAAPKPGTASVSGFQWPVNGRVGSGFGYRTHPIFGTKRLHKGIDMGAGSGTPIAAAKGGTVILAGWSNGYGNTVIISHGGGITTLYAHQTKVNVSAGQEVSRGDIIGFVGSTGWSTGPHLHFEVRSNGTAIDPAPYLP